jgi:hypothetical protein
VALQPKKSIVCSKSKSLSATIPEGIAEYLQLQPGETLEWRMETFGNERVATIRKAE